MNFNISKSEYTGNWHKTVVCDRCKRIIASAQCNKKPIEDEVSICRNCAVEMWTKENKLISELEERIADGDKDFEMANNQNERLLKIVRHQKYKRCLAMAEFCQYRSEMFFTWSKKMGFLLKWQNRWLKLAEKFKEEK